MQEIRIDLRREAIREENEAIKKARAEKTAYRPMTFKNGDTTKQLLARSRHLLFKSSGDWTRSQEERAEILFKHYPALEHAYHLSMQFRNCYESSDTKADAKKALAKWYGSVEKKNLDPFLVAAESIRLHEETILN